MHLLPLIVGSLLPLTALTSAVPAPSDPPCIPGTPQCRPDAMKRSVVEERSKLKCYHDNLFRAIKRKKGYPFCTAYLSDPTTTVPAYLKLTKTYTPQQLSSACSCVGPDPNAPPASTDCPINGCISAGYITGSIVDNAQACASYCTSTSGCLSYQVGPDNETGNVNCNLMNVAAKDAWYNETPVDSYCSQYNIYDITCPAPTSCPACHPSSASPVTTSSSFAEASASPAEQAS